MLGHKLQISVAVALLACGFLVSATIGHGTTDAERVSANRSEPYAPRFSIRHDAGGINLAGTSASTAHETRLRQVVEDEFNGVDTTASFTAGVLLPDGWEKTSTLVVHALAATDTGYASLSGGLVEIRGITSDRDTMESRLEELHANMPPDTALTKDIVVVEDATSLAELCGRALDYAVAEPVAFRQSSAELRSSSFGVLDRIVEIANDCRASRIAITGHSDSAGPEAWNQLLSLRRAQAVADYIAGKGIPEAQLSIAGAGSSEPIATNDTPYGRSLNRRIEFEVR